MPADASGAILSAIQDKVDLCSADAQQTHGRQIHQSVEHYQSVTDWACYGQKDMDHDRKLSIMAKRMVSLFLVNPSEPTIASAVAIALHHDGPLNPAYLLTKVSRMKTFLQAMTKDMTCCDAPANYPSDVEKFKEEHSTIYTLAFQNDPVMQCPIDAVTMQFFKQITPCRKTRSGCSDMIAQHCNQIAVAVLASSKIPLDGNHRTSNSQASGGAYSNRSLPGTRRSPCRRRRLNNMGSARCPINWPCVLMTVPQDRSRPKLSSRRARPMLLCRRKLLRRRARLILPPRKVWWPTSPSLRSRRR